ncbi:MAG TPA: DoxX family protein [Micromonosporaceae bacterium]|nr:DoxX family protein [Micromonosporaceae bacterium]
MRPVRRAARAMLGAIFIASGMRGLANSEKLVPGAKRVTDRITPLLEKVDPRLPTDPRTLVRINAAAQLAGGLLLATGRMPRPAAALLAGTMIPTTLAGHPFWTEQDPVARRNQQIHFLKNVGLIGGLLLAAADTEGRPSVGWRVRHAVRTRTGRATLTR